MRRRPPHRHGPRRGRAEHGFALATVVFLLVILGSIVAAVGALRERGSQANVLEVRQARAALAVRAGLEWGAWKVRDPDGTLAPGSGALPPCFASQDIALPGGLAEFTVTVSCSRAPDIAASPPYYEEDARRLAVYTVTAVASAGAVDTPSRVQRRMQMRIENCKDPAAAAPSYAC